MINRQEIIDVLNDVLDSMDADTYSQRELCNRIEYTVENLKREDRLLTEAGLSPEVEQCPLV